MQLIEVADRHATSLASFPLGAVRMTERFLPGFGPGPQAGPPAAPRPRARGARRARRLPPRGDRDSSASAARYATSRRPPAHRPIGDRHRRPGARDHPRDALRRSSRRSRRCPSAERGKVPGIKPGAATSSSPPRSCSRPWSSSGGFAGIEVTEASLRDGVFLARELLADAPEPLFDDVRSRGRAQPRDPVRVGPPPRRARCPALAPDVRLARRRRAVRARARRARAAVGRRDAPRRRDDDLLRRPPQALVLPDRQRRAVRASTPASAR